MKTYDLRSDTLTKPTEAMRKAMYNAEVGDDVYGEDPTVNQLQDLASEITGKEGALFVSTGSMGNLIPIYLLCGRGNEIIAHKLAHVLNHEMASLTSIAGAMPVVVDGPRGVVPASHLEDLIRGPAYYVPRTKMIEIESSHNLASGACYSKAELEAISRFAGKHSLAVHLDGARMFNASIATNMPVKEICSHTTTVTFCLSKGLGAPVGSVLCGDAEFIAEARRVRKLLGGGTRQAGVLAAAGIYALENNISRLADDHENAGKLAEALAETAWAEIDPASIQTNIIYFGTKEKPAEELADQLTKNGIRCAAAGPDQIRWVTSLEQNRDDIGAIREILLKFKS